MDDDSDCQRRRGDLLIQLETIEAIRAGTWKADADTPLMAARRAILDDAPPADAQSRRPTLRVIQGGKSDKQGPTRLDPHPRFWSRDGVRYSRRACWDSGASGSATTMQARTPLASTKPKTSQEAR